VVSVALGWVNPLRRLLHLKRLEVMAVQDRLLVQHLFIQLVL
jgi:hypothetical protein